MALDAVQETKRALSAAGGNGVSPSAAGASGNGASGDGTTASTTRRIARANGRAVGADAAASPGLVFFYSDRSGPSRRVDGFLAQVLQRRGNHETFRIYRVATESRPDLVERFGIEALPALVVVENRKVRGRLVLPRGCEQIESFLAPWLK